MEPVTLCHLAGLPTISAAQATEAMIRPVQTWYQSNPQQAIELMGQAAEPVRNLELTPENWREEFGESLTIQTPIGR